MAANTNYPNIKYSSADGYHGLLWAAGICLALTIIIVVANVMKQQNIKKELSRM